MIADCTIRPFAPDDLARLHEIRMAAFRPVFPSFRAIVGEAIAEVAFARAEAEQADHLDKMCRPDSGREVHVVERDGRIVAFFGIALDHDTKLGELDLNAVDPAEQGRGIGTNMVAFALVRMMAAGMRVATVGTGGDPAHAPARRAYEKAGFGPAIPGMYYYKAL